MAAPTRLQNQALMLSDVAQSSPSTVAASFQRWRKLNKDIAYLDFNTENDKEEIGKVNEFISSNGIFATYVEPAGLTIDKYGSPEWMLWCWAYALGVVSSPTSGQYLIHALDPNTAVELPYLSAATILSGPGGTVIDEAYLGCIVESVTTEFHYGPTRASVKTNATIVGLGLYDIPSGLIGSVPTSTVTEYYTKTSSMTMTINGTNYVTTGRGLMGTLAWKNNPPLGLRFVPGSGVDANGFAQGNHIYIGDRSVTFTFTAFLEFGSTELASLMALTQGSIVLTFTFSSTEFVTFTCTEATFAKVTRKQEEGFVAVDVTVDIQNDTTVVSGLANGPLVVSGKCSLNSIVI